MRRHAPLALAAALFLGAAGRDAADRWIDTAPLPPLGVATSVEVLDRDERPLHVFLTPGGFWRLPARADRVDGRFLAMLLAQEDRRFFSHGGVDARAGLRAAWQAVRAGRVVSGASTLTMQTARLLDGGGTGRWGGKLRQVRLALALERRASKADILALYLTLAPYGGNIEGVRAASLAWFGKEPGRLTPAEAALLVALPQAPERRRPDLHPAVAAAARDRVLARAVAAGIIDADTALAARGEPVPVARAPLPSSAPHLAARLRAEAPGTRRIVTTLDGDLQRRLERLAAAAAERAGPAISAAIVVADHRTGAMLASVGSAGRAAAGRQGFVDMTRALRSPGSTLKPLVYALGFDAGLVHPETLIDDAPVRFGSYAPQNFDGAFRGPLPVRRALQLSLNVPVVRLAEALGPARVVAAMRRAGVRPEMAGGRPGLAVVLGGLGVRLEDMVGLYAALAAGGEARPLWAVRPPAGGSGARVTGAAAAWQVGRILSRIPPPAGGATGAIAYKTGTSYGYRDAWAFGWDGAHAAGVWLGRPDGTPVPGAFGGELAAPVLHETFARLPGARSPLPPPPPGTLLVGASTLPRHLRVFGGPGGAAQGPELAFPPDGARLADQGLPVIARLGRGTPPFTWLADGRPVLTEVHERTVALPLAGPGFVTLSVIDASGRSARATIRLE